MRGILLVCPSESHPDELLRGANCDDMFRPPARYVLEFAIQVAVACKVANGLSTVLTKAEPNGRAHFYRASLNEVHKYFTLMVGMGAHWIKEYEEQKELIPVAFKVNEPTRDKKRLWMVVKAGQIITHSIALVDGKEDIWCASFTEGSTVMHDSKLYSSVSKFAQAHKERHGQKGAVNGWNECKIEIDGRSMTLNDAWEQMSSKK